MKDTESSLGMWRSRYAPAILPRPTGADQMGKGFWGKGLSGCWARIRTWVSVRKTLHASSTPPRIAGPGRYRPSTTYYHNRGKDWVKGACDIRRAGNRMVEEMEAASGFEPLRGALRAPALPLGYTARRVLAGFSRESTPACQYYIMRLSPGKTRLQKLRLNWLVYCR